MTIKQIPIDPIPNQVIAFEIGDKGVSLKIQQAGGSVFTSVWVDGVQIISCVRAVNGGKIFPFPTSAIDTDLQWLDTQGDDDPQYEGLGTRWLLVFTDDDDE